MSNSQNKQKKINCKSTKIHIELKLIIDLKTITNKRFKKFPQIPLPLKKLFKVKNIGFSHFFVNISIILKICQKTVVNHSILYNNCLIFLSQKAPFLRFRDLKKLYCMHTFPHHQRGSILGFFNVFFPIHILYNQLRLTFLRQYHLIN